MKFIPTTPEHRITAKSKSQLLKKDRKLVFDKIFSANGYKVLCSFIQQKNGSVLI